MAAVELRKVWHERDLSRPLANLPMAAIDEGVPVPVLNAALFERFSSRGGGNFANRVLSAMREEFGAHAAKSVA